MNGRWNMQDVQDWLYVVIVGALALYLVIGVVAWTWMILTGVAVPDAFATILAAIAGALAGIVTPLSRPGSRERDVSRS
ncbi:MAG: hypothetical protein ACLFRD_08305 [Nitriliruptoraceae bacterium]